VPATEIVEVRFKGNRRHYFTADPEVAVDPGVAVIVQLERGQDLGRVSAVGDAARRKCAVGCQHCGPDDEPEVAGRILRPASKQDVHVQTELRRVEDDIRRKVRERVRTHNLAMKVSDAEWQWDRKKLTIYFTADHRVDFRQLVRELAGLFRTRIELRQIGARDEAKRLTGVGRCGREYCCSSWLPELRPVSLSLAKDQHLSLNPSQISGGCGRLLCCLRYEHAFYVASRKRFPKEGRSVITSRGRERVQAIDIFRERVLLRAEDSTVRAVPLSVLKEETAAAATTQTTTAPPSSLTTFDEGGSTVGEDRAADAVSPGRSRRRRRRTRGRRSRPERPPRTEPPSDDSPGDSG